MVREKSFVTIRGRDMLDADDLTSNYGVACEFVGENFVSIMLQTDSRQEARDFLHEVASHNKTAIANYRKGKVTLRVGNLTLIYFLLSKDELR